MMRRGKFSTSLWKTRDLVYYYYEGPRKAIFLGEPVVKYHRTLTTYLNTLLQNGLTLQHIIEPQPPAEMMDIQA